LPSLALPWRGRAFARGRLVPFDFDAFPRCAVSRSSMQKPLSLAVYIIAIVARPKLAMGADAYDDAMDRARAAERRGDPAAAARILEPVARAYDQDYTVALELAWDHFQATEYPEAERAYRLAITRAPASTDARLGLAWAIARQGRCDDAERELGGLAIDARGREPIDACPVAKTSLGAAYGQTYFPNHPLKTSASGLLANASTTRASGFTLGAAYRYLRVSTNGTLLSSFEQNEGYGFVGYESERYGIVARGAIVRDGSGYTGTSKHVGLTGHVALGGGDLVLDTALSVYDDRTIGRVAPTWVFRVAGPLRLAPGFAVQPSGSYSLANVSLSAFLDFSALSLWIGAKYGDEDRPAYLASSVVYDIPERVAWGAWAGATVRFGAFAVTASYALDDLRRTDALTPHESLVHAFNAGPIFTF
jgi:hypothetical protein